MCQAPLEGYSLAAQKKTAPILGRVYNNHTINSLLPLDRPYIGGDGVDRTRDLGIMKPSL